MEVYIKLQKGEFTLFIGEYWFGFQMLKHFKMSEQVIARQPVVSFLYSYANPHVDLCPI